MNRKYIYPILVILVTLAFYFINDKMDEELLIQDSEDFEAPEMELNTYFLPKSTTGQIIHHNYYSLSYEEEFEQAEWVAYELKKNHLSRNDHNRPYFEIDNKVKTKAAHWKNYKNSGYSRGHLCPAGDRKFSKDAYEETFLTSNISPQKQDFNAGIWNTLEQKVRYWARKYDGVYVVTGGILKPGLNTIGDEEVAVPEQFYKIVLDNNNGNMKMIAFLIPHSNSDKALYKFVVSVDKIEELTGIDFFPNLDDKKEEKLEAKSDYKLWSLGF